MSLDDNAAWLILGVDRQQRATVAVVVGTVNADTAKEVFGRAYPRLQILSWPQLSDLKKSVAIMDRALAGENVEECPVLRVRNEPEDQTSPADPAMVALKAIRLVLVERGHGDPFGNNGERFESQAFIVRAYDWDDPEDGRGMFRWRDYEVRWVKHLNRETEPSRTMNADEAQAMADECIAAILAQKGTL